MAHALRLKFPEENVTEGSMEAPVPNFWPRQMYWLWNMISASENLI